jgi:methylenetetrahydrofolate reductase (NADPH)
MANANVTAFRTPSSANPAAPTQSIWSGWSLEASAPTPAEIKVLNEDLTPGSRIYLSALPRVSHDHQFEAAKMIREAGFDPVPHIAARKFSSRNELADHLAALTGRAGVTRALIVAGDLSRPLGPYADTLDLLNDDAFLRSGIAEIGISGYPEGHPLIEEDLTDKLLARKTDLASQAGMSVEIVTQFCFSATSIIDWHDRIRRQGIIVPIRVGLAGPASPSALLKLALRCGVSLPLRHTNVAMKLLKGMSADDIVAELADSTLESEAGQRIALHFYSFGGIKRTANWASLSEADFALNR